MILTHPAERPETLGTWSALRAQLSLVWAALIRPYLFDRIGEGAWA